MHRKRQRVLYYKRRSDDQDRLSAMCHDVRLLISSMLEPSDIVDFACVARLYRHGWLQHTVAIKQVPYQPCSETLAGVMAWLGEKVKYVRDLTIGHFDKDYDVDVVVRQLGQFKRLTALELGIGHSYTALRILKERTLPMLRTARSYGFLSGSNKVIDNDPPSSVVEWKCPTSPKEMLRCPTWWLNGLRSLYLNHATFDAKVTTAVLHHCPLLRELNVNGRFDRSKNSLDDDWVNATFVGSCSREMTNIEFRCVSITWGVKSLQRIAEHCPKMEHFNCSPNDDVTGQLWNDMIPVFERWTSTLRTLVFDVLRRDEATDEFFLKTRFLCPLLEHIDILKMNEAVHNWNYEHRLLPLPHPF